MPPSQVLSQPVGVIGAGVAGLINGHVLLQDGFTDVTLISRDKSVGGVWARERVYPGLHINNVHGEYRFSALDMPPPDRSDATGGRLTGVAMCDYMESFSKKFLQDKATFRFQTEVLDIQRSSHATGQADDSTWEVKVEDLQSGRIESLRFARLILATGGCSNPRIPADLSPKAAENAQFRGLVFHTSEFGSRLGEVLSLVPPFDKNADANAQDAVVVIGGGKSAKDVCAKLANEGRKVTIVFDTTDVFLATPKPLPAFIRKSRILSLLMPHYTLRSRLERFLHTTWLGSKILHFILGNILEGSFQAYDIPKGSPLRRTHSLFWGVRLSDDGNVRADSYHGLVKSGAIHLAAPARAIGYSEDGTSVLLSDGSSLPAKVVILATGYQSSWSKIFSKEMAEEIGIARHAPTTTVANNCWKYKSMENGPRPHPENQNWVTSIYRGLVPAKNILRRDFAIAGALFTANPGYTNELVAHWISSYFQGDKMRLPATQEEAKAHAERQSAWMKIRFPDMLSWVNESYSGSLDFWTWPQAADELLEDMYLPSCRSGGNWLTWPFKILDLKEISTLGQERRALRGQPPSCPST